MAYITAFGVPYCKAYGDIVYCKKTNTLETTLEQRTGCMFCMFGVHLEKHPNRFERMHARHPKQWDVCINKLGCGKVMDFIGVTYT